MPMTDVAPLGLGGPTSSAWREEMLTRAEELDGLSSWIFANPDHTTPVGGMKQVIDNHLGAATATAAGTDARRLRRTWRSFTGSSFERTLGNLDAVEVHLLRLAPVEVLKGAMPSIEAHVNRFLPKDDPRRIAVAKLTADPPTAPDADRRDVLIGAQHAANTQRRRDLIRLRGFRNMVLSGIIVFTLIALGLGFVGQKHPTAIPLCFTPEESGNVTLVCPRGERSIGPVDLATYDLDDDLAATVTSGDVWLVEFVGLLGAALAGAAALRNLRGTSTPYAVPLALAVLKLPTGAVTAVIGLLLMRADFVPGLSALDSPAQILGWAIVFGIAQQLVTRFADNQASTILESVGGRGPAGDRPLKPA
jgi:hypothetical protein